VEGGLKLWYYYTSRDLKNYEDRSVFLTPTIEEEKSGVYSGSANIEDGKLVFYYTGNVKYKGDYDYVHEGRGHNTISFETEDGINFTEKKCLLTTDDYPNMSNHVRDPKIFEKNGKNYLVLGARDSNDYGCLLVFDKDTLKPYKTIYSEKNLGFMWECPDYFEVDGKEIFMFSPQGITRMYPNYGNMYQIGYSVVEEGIENVDKLDNFTLLDYGHDFYASQTFLDEDNNRVLIGWMYVPDSSYTNPTIKFGYQNCLTVPRVVNYKDGKVRQTLHKSVKDLLGNDIKTNDFNKNTWYYKQEHDKEFEISVADFKVSYDNKELKVRYLLIDTPETVKPGVEVQKYGPEASKLNGKLLSNAKDVEIEFDVYEKEDKYHRALCYVYADGKNVQEELLLAGLAEIKYVKPPDTRYLSKFKKAQNKAKSNKRNLWSGV